jgi:hypothetical protein
MDKKKKKKGDFRCFNTWQTENGWVVEVWREGDDEGKSYCKHNLCEVLEFISKQACVKK